MMKAMDFVTKNLGTLIGYAILCMKICFCCYFIGVGVPKGEPSVHEGVRRGTIWQGASDEGKGESTCLMFEHIVKMSNACFAAHDTD